MLNEIHGVSFILYNAFLIPVTFFSFVYYLAALRSILSRDEPAEQKSENPVWPHVTIQIPTYNEPVAIRCAKSCLEFDYPKEKFDILIGDDSTDNEVSGTIDDFAKEAGRAVQVVRRGHNIGFKAGNLNNMLKYTKGEIIVIFDSDFVASKDFLKNIVKPFIKDKNVACVQAEWDFLNINTNHISKLSSALLLFYYSLIVPINKKLRIPLLFGSGEAVRKEVLTQLGGWNEKSLTEDTEFSIRALRHGYKIEYLDKVKVHGEVPYTLKGLLSQQRRWAYGNTRVFLEHSKHIFLGPFTLLQKIMITYTTALGYFSNFVLLLFFISGTIFFFSQPPAPINLIKFLDQTSRLFLITSGFMIGGVIALYKKERMRILLPSLLTVLTMGILVSCSVCVGFFKAVFGKELTWSAINKEGNYEFIDPQETIKEK